MTTRQAWSAARIFARAIGLPPGGESLTAEAAWRVVMIVQAYEEASEVMWRQAMVQAIISGGTQEGFDSVARAFRLYRETANPWLEVEREKEEERLRKKVAEFVRHRITVKPIDMPKIFPGMSTGSRKVLLDG